MSHLFTSLKSRHRTVTKHGLRSRLFSMRIKRRIFLPRLFCDGWVVWFLKSLLQPSFLVTKNKNNKFITLNQNHNFMAKVNGDHSDDE